MEKQHSLITVKIFFKAKPNYQHNNFQFSPDLAHLATFYVLGI